MVLYSAKPAYVTSLDGAQIRAFRQLSSEQLILADESRFSMIYTHRIYMLTLGVYWW